MKCVTAVHSWKAVCLFFQCLYIRLLRKNTVSGWAAAMVQRSSWISISVSVTNWAAYSWKSPPATVCSPPSWWLEFCKPVCMCLDIDRPFALILRSTSAALQIFAACPLYLTSVCVLVPAAEHVSHRPDKDGQRSRGSKSCGPRHCSCS